MPITESTAPYIAEVCDNWYIASTIRNRINEKQLTTEEGVRDALTLETTAGKGAVAKMWGEYLLAAFPPFDGASSGNGPKTGPSQRLHPTAASEKPRINGPTARKIVLYLASREPEERTRKQIRADLELDEPDDELEVKLHQLVKADIIADGSTNFRYCGLGDRVFAMVFRRIYGEEIEDLSVREIEAEFKQELATARRQAARHRGAAAEYKVRYRLFMASLRGATLADVVTQGAPEGIVLGPFSTLRKAHFHPDPDHSVEIDVHAVHEHEDGTDLMVEVKDWERTATADAARRFVEVKEKLSAQIERRTVFLFYSESGLSEEAEATLREAGALILDPEKLAGYEALLSRRTRCPG